jgi:hypothetical protein
VVLKYSCSGIDVKMYEKKSILLGPYIPVAANFLSKMAPDIRKNVFRSMLQREYVMPRV